MREILFRGKRMDNGEWVKGAWLPVTNTIMHEKGLGMGFSAWFVDPETVGQFTGLTDKNGKKIFEGDIFKFPDEVWESYYTSCGTEYNSWETENYGVVGFSEYYGRYDFVQYKHSNNTVDADMHENNDLEFVDFISGLEVIGNIHDNPERLKGAENDL